MSRNSPYLGKLKDFWSVEDPVERKYNRIDVIPEAERSEAYFASRTRDRVDWLLDRITLPETGRVLEIGFGIGAVLEQMAKRLSTARFYGIDISRVMLKEAEKRLSRERFELCLGDGDNLSGYADDYFDYVFCTMVFIHIQDVQVIKNYLIEVRRVLRPGSPFRFNIRYRDLSKFSRSLGGRLLKLRYQIRLTSFYRTVWNSRIAVDFTGLPFTVGEIENLVLEAGLKLDEVQLKGLDAIVTCSKAIA